MPRRLGSSIALAAVVLASVGCGELLRSDDRRLGGGERVAEAAEAIINGEADPVHDAVCALATDQGGTMTPFCTATIIAVDGSTGYALSAAHCTAGVPTFGQGSPPSADYLWCIDDFDDPCPGPTCVVYPIREMRFNPAYDGGPGSDVSMLTFDQATEATAVIPLADLDDGLAEGDAIEVSGYGLVEGFAQPTGRRHAFTIIGDTSLDPDTVALYGDAFEAPQSATGPHGGTCSGDSGGPVLVGSGAATRVVGTTSQGDQSCDLVGFYCRVSQPATYAFITSYMGIGPGDSCDACTAAAFSVRCSDRYQACVSNGACNALLDCVNACTTGACADACSADHPDGVAGYDALFACAVCQECSTTCRSDACGGTTPSTATSTAAGAGGSGGGTDGPVPFDYDPERDEAGCNVGPAGAIRVAGAAPAGPAPLLGVMAACAAAAIRRRRS